MLRRLEVNALRADIQSLESLLSTRTEDEDPVGWLQYSARKDMLEHQLNQIQSQHRSTAIVGLFFGGRPVLGSRGILADFGAKALDQFQTIVSTTYASLEGPIGTRGPVRQRDRTQMMVTDIARGSVGFILEEADEEQLVDSHLKTAVTLVLNLLARASSPDEEAFDLLTDAADGRVLGSVQSFFKLLDESGATLKLVEDEREFLLSREYIERARERTETLTISDRSEKVEGCVYLLPTSRRFELQPVDGGETLKGTVSEDALKPILSFDGNVVEGVIGKQTVVELRIREIKVANRAPRLSYYLTRIEK